MRFRKLQTSATSARLRRCGRAALVCLSTGTLLTLTSVALAENTLPDGEYTAVFKGNIHFVDREPSRQQIVEETTIKVASSGDSMTITVGQIGSAMSATRFTGKSGQSKFVAMHSVPGRENQAKVIWGQVNSGGIVRGTLLYPRVADGLVPGFTELAFEARPEGSNATSSSSMPARPGLNRRPSIAPALPSGSSSSSEGKKKKELKPRQPPAGTSSIYGTISGDTSVILNVELIDENENTLQTTTLDQNGRYRFDGLGAAVYWIYVNDGRAEAYITTTSDDRSVNADGRSSYRMDFNVRN